MYRTLTYVNILSVFVEERLISKLQFAYPSNGAFSSSYSHYHCLNYYHYFKQYDTDHH